MIHRTITQETGNKIFSIEKTITLEIAKNEYSLSIRISSDGFSLSVLDIEGESVLLKRNVSAFLFQMSKEEIKVLFEEKAGIVFSDYTDVQLIVESEFYEFVPQPLFKLKNLDDYFYFQHEKDKQQLILFNRIPNWNVVNVFSIPIALNGALNELFEEAVITHHLSCFLSDKIQSKADCIYVWVGIAHLDIVVLNAGKLSLINTFTYHTDEDLAYYVLSMYEQFKFDTEQVSVKLFQHENTSRFKDVISLYVKNVI